MSTTTESPTSSPADDKRIYLAYLAVASATALANLAVLLIIVVYKKWTNQSQRFLLVLAIGNLLGVTFDIQPAWVGWGVTNFAIQSGIFQGARYMVAATQAVILIYTPLVLQRAKGLPRNVERAMHAIVLTVAFGVGTFVGLSVHHAGATPDNEDMIRGELDTLTYVWLGLVALVILLFVRLQLVVRALRRAWTVQHDPDFEPRSAYAIRAKLVHLQQQLLTNIVGPLNMFPVIFVVTALGEVGLVLMRNLREPQCANFHNSACLGFLVASNLLIDLSGLLMAVAYFRDHEARHELSASRIRRRLDRSRRGVRFSSNNHEYAHLPLAHEGTDPADAQLPAMTMKIGDANRYYNQRTSATASVTSSRDSEDPDITEDSPPLEKPKRVFQKEGRFSSAGKAATAAAAASLSSSSSGAHSLGKSPKQLQTGIDRDFDDTDNEGNEHSDGESDDEYQSLIRKV